MFRIILFSLLLILAAAPAAAATPETTPSGQPVPRFVTLKFGAVNGRIGPSRAHPVAWRYARAGLPVEVIAETPDWRRVRDPEGEVTWMHQSVLSGRRAVYVRTETPLRARPRADAPEEAVAEPGAVLWLERCRAGWCRLEAQGLRGWADTSGLWGIYPYELAETPALSAAAAHDTAGR
ncbi:MAG: hypothetical protein KIS81_05990 [Maricaulaceae bacterium]|nr:hypothetical protein [Maricaulaceae bacterium]